LVQVTPVFTEPDGATPIEQDDLDELIPTWIGTRRELDRAEQANIVTAVLWAHRRRWAPADLLHQGALQELHQRMFSDVWRWAGAYRTRQTNLGVAWTTIAVEVEALLRDIDTQLVDDTKQAWSHDEIAIRFHHRLVSIHPFLNGNGRHARFCADLLIEALGGASFTWGSGADLSRTGDARRSYIEALRVLDGGRSVQRLLEFARS
jgi:Fic-DOC domain mobile mystery protein B